MSKPRSATPADLGTLRDALKAQADAQARARADAAVQQRAAQEDADAFRSAVGAVRPLAASSRAQPARTPPAPQPLQTRRDEHAALAATLSDEFDPDALLDADDALHFRRPGIAADVVRKLRRGAWVVQAQLDLHGMRRDEAREALAAFLRDAVARGLRCVRVIHGKGLGSVNREPVLKGKVRSWLQQKAEVVAFCQARPHDGGDGAALVLLQPASHRAASRNVGTDADTGADAS